MKIYDTTNNKSFNVEDGIFLTETQADLSIYDVFEYKSKHYVVSRLLKEDGLRVAGVSKLNRHCRTPKPQEYNTNFVCPYCGDIESNAWELENDGEKICGKCGATLEYERHVTIEYSTYPKNPPHIIEI